MQYRMLLIFGYILSPYVFLALMHLVSNVISFETCSDIQPIFIVINIMGAALSIHCLNLLYKEIKRLYFINVLIWLVFIVPYAYLAFVSMLSIGPCSFSPH